MPFYIIGEKEFNDPKSEGYKKLRKIISEELVDYGAEKSLTPKKRIAGDIFTQNLSFLVSVSPEGEPLAYLSFRFPRAKGKSIFTERSYTRKKFRSRGTLNEKRQGHGGEQVRLFFRLCGIARARGIEFIEAPVLNWKMMDFYQKIKENPRVWVNSGELSRANVERLGKELAKLNPGARAATGRQTERIRLISPRVTGTYGAASIEVRRPKRKNLK